MTKQALKKILEKQMQLLSERSQAAPQELPSLTQSMTALGYQLMELSKK